MSEGLSAHDIISIISACKKNSVSSFKCGELVLEFTNKPKHIRPMTVVEAPSTQAEPDPQPEFDPDILMIEDPLGYERWNAEQQESGAN